MGKKGQSKPEGWIVKDNHGKDAWKPDQGPFAFEKAEIPPSVPRTVRLYQCGCGTHAPLTHVAACSVMQVDQQFYFCMQRRLTAVFAKETVQQMGLEEGDYPPLQLMECFPPKMGQALSFDCKQHDFVNARGNKVTYLLEDFIRQEELKFFGGEMTHWTAWKRLPLFSPHVQSILEPTEALKPAVPFRKGEVPVTLATGWVPTWVYVVEASRRKHYRLKEEFDLFKPGCIPLSKASCGAIKLASKRDIEASGQPFIPDASKKNGVLVSPRLVMWYLAQEEDEKLGLPPAIPNATRGARKQYLDGLRAIMAEEKKGLERATAMQAEIDAREEEKEEQGHTGVVDLTMCESEDEEPLKLPSTPAPKTSATPLEGSSTTKRAVAKRNEIQAQIKLLTEMGVDEDEARELIKDPKKVGGFLAENAKKHQGKGTAASNKRPRTESASDDADSK